MSTMLRVGGCLLVASGIFLALTDGHPQANRERDARALQEVDELLDDALYGDPDDEAQQPLSIETKPART